jgi:hypothetical protein
MRTNFKMENENITMVRGDTLSFNVEVTDESGQAVAVDSADFTCKKNAMGEESIFHKSLGAGIEQDDGLLTIRVAPQDTENAEAGRYFYDLQLGVGEDRFTVMIGVLAIEQDVTN